MLGSEVREVLRQRGIYEIHHANTVTTSCTFLREGGLASRGYNDDRQLPQTPQPMSDEIDQKFGLWYDVFADSVDIHDRAKRLNQYGPVLFVLSTSVLSELPAHSTVLVTKRNPIYWTDNESEDHQWFADINELSMGFTKGTFGQMIVIRTPEGILPFSGRVSVVLDDPHKHLRSGVDAFKWASKRLMDAAEQGGVDLQIHKRRCPDGCHCIENYTTADLAHLFE